MQFKILKKINAHQQARLDIMVQKHQALAKIYLAVPIQIQSLKLFWSVQHNDLKT